MNCRMMLAFLLVAFASAKTIRHPQKSGYYFHSTTSANKVCSMLGYRLGGSNKHHGRRRVCRIWYSNNLRNMGCGNSEPYVTSVNCVTRRPTNRPTRRPTPRPTRFPTPRPTRFPTPRPTRFPTAYPTAYPTAFPTAYPTAQPTAYPTSTPTGILSHGQCLNTICTYELINGVARTTVSYKRSAGEKWHCEKSGNSCKCVCDRSLNCALRHHHETGYKKTLTHC